MPNKEGKKGRPQQESNLQATQKQVGVSTNSATSSMKLGKYKVTYGDQQAHYTGSINPRTMVSLSLLMEYISISLLAFILLLIVQRGIPLRAEQNHEPESK